MYSTAMFFNSQEAVKNSIIFLEQNRAYAMI